jgi:hypothetical protein
MRTAAMPYSCHQQMPCSLPVAAGDVMTGLNRYHSRSREGPVFYCLPASLSSVSRSWAASFL